MGPLTSLFCPGGGFLYTMIVLGGGFCPLGVVSGGMVLDETDSYIIRMITVHTMFLYCKRIFRVSELKKWSMHLQQALGIFTIKNFHIKSVFCRTRLTITYETRLTITYETRKAVTC